tara:strand:+ start:111 stop:611 length:501 start_codon:yes stop_codon:yes gene_type:complete
MSAFEKAWDIAKWDPDNIIPPSDHWWHKHGDASDFTSDEPIICGFNPATGKVTLHTDTEDRGAAFFGGCGRELPLSAFSKDVRTNPKWRTAGGGPINNYDRVPQSLNCNECKDRMYARFLPVMDAIREAQAIDPDAELDVSELDLEVREDGWTDPDEELWRRGIGE